MPAEVRTTRQTGGLLSPYKGVLLTSASRRWLSLCSSLTVFDSLPPYKRAFLLRATPEGVFVFFDTQFVQCNIMCFLFSNVFLYRRLI